MQIETKLLSGALGAEIKVIDLTDISDENFKRINDLLLEHKVIFFRDQPLTTELHIALAEKFGPLETHAYVQGLDDHPEIVRIIKNPNENIINKLYSDNINISNIIFILLKEYIHTKEIDIFNNYNQSTMQSVFFVNQAFYNGNILNYNDNISVLCDDTIVGGRTWNGQMTDIIAMGYDGYEFTEGYCEQTQTITMQIENDDISSEMYIIGNQEWSNNNISIVSISNFQLGDINFDDNINVTDIIMLIEHIISSSIIDNDHQLLLSDINSDGNINVSDIVFIVDLIIE